MSSELHTLSNGVRVVTEPMPGFGSATVGVWIGAGGRHERVGQTGLAHFLEHMVFKRTKTRSALQIASAIEDVGGYLNAYTSREVTCYHARLLAEHVPLAVDILADITLNSVYAPEDLETERGVILQEIGMVADTPDDIVFDWLQDVAYPGQPMGRPILGESVDIGSYSREDLMGFARGAYHPGNIILSAAGGIDPADVLRLAEKAFGHLPTSKASPFEAARYGGGDLRVAKELEQAHVALAFEAPDYRDDAFQTAQLYSSIMGGGITSRLFQEIRENRGLCYSVFSQISGYEDTGMMTVYAGTSGEDLRELLDVTVGELKRATDITEEELVRAKAMARAGLVMGLESSWARAERNARMVAIWGRVPPVEEAAAKIDAVTLGALRDFSGRLLTSKPSVVLYGPVSDAPDGDALASSLAA